MSKRTVNPSEQSFKALCAALGWPNAARFLRQYDLGAGNYTEERAEILPDWDASTLARRAREAGRAHAKKR